VGHTPEEHALPDCPVVPLKHTTSPSDELAGPVNFPKVLLAQVNSEFRFDMTCVANAVVPSLKVNGKDEQFAAHELPLMNSRNNAAKSAFFITPPR
jgi:hypothetical protein